jgi:ATP-dependent RNA helicase DDX49/DBP8
MAPSHVVEESSEDQSPGNSPKSPSQCSDNEDHEFEADINRPSKRRRVSISSDDSYVAAPFTLPTLSRIKKKSDIQPQGAPEEEEPITSRDALDIGIQVSDSTFATLNVAPWLVGSLSTMAIRRPTAIQRACIPEIIKGRDCIGGSRTGSGKTVAFAVPILQKWSEDPFGIFAVVLTPTR